LPRRDLDRRVDRDPSAAITRNARPELHPCVIAPRPLRVSSIPFALLDLIYWLSLRKHLARSHEGDLLLNAETLADVAGRVSPRSFRCRPLHLKSSILPSSLSSLYSLFFLSFVYRESQRVSSSEGSSDEKRDPDVQMSRVFCRGLAWIPRAEEWNGRGDIYT